MFWPLNLSMTPNFQTRCHSWPPKFSGLQIKWSAWLGSQTLRISHRTSQVRKMVHNFSYILSQISCGKMQKHPQIFYPSQCRSFSWVRCSFPDYLDQLIKIWKILRDMVHTKVLSICLKYINMFAKFDEKFQQWDIKKRQEMSQTRDECPQRNWSSTRHIWGKIAII